MQSEQEQIKSLMEKVHQFLSHQTDNNQQLDAASRESLQVAAECIEQAYQLQKKGPSRELLDIYAKSQQQQANPAAFIQNLASSILSSATAGTGSQQQQQAPEQAAQRQEQQQTSNNPPKVRKLASEAERLAAESFKNQGNDYMKQDLHKEAYDSYTKAIEIDNNNAIYYSNRAAALSKMGDHEGALKDCQEAVEIDPTYSKAYGRMGLAYASLAQHQKAKEAYVKAVELDPTNESYRNNMKIAEENLAQEADGGAAGNAGGGDASNGVMNMLRSMMMNPEVMQMAMNSLQDPRVQNLFGMAAGAAGGAAAAAASAASAAAAAVTGATTTTTTNTTTTTTTTTDNQATPGETPSERTTTAQTNTPTNNQQQSANSATTGAGQEQQQQAGINPADLFNIGSRIAGAANIDLVGAGQQLLSSIEQSNPDLVNNMRRMMNQAFMPPQGNPNDSDRNPPPGYS